MFYNNWTTNNVTQLKRFRENLHVIREVNYDKVIYNKIDIKHTENLVNLVKWLSFIEEVNPSLCTHHNSFPELFRFGEDGPLEHCEIITRGHRVHQEEVNKYKLYANCMLTDFSKISCHWTHECKVVLKSLASDVRSFSGHVEPRALKPQDCQFLYRSRGAMCSWTTRLSLPFVVTWSHVLCKRQDNQFRFRSRGATWC